MSLTPKDYWAIIKGTFSDFSEDNPMNYAAIIAYYTVFSLPAILILVLKIASLIFGEEAVTGQLFGQIKGIVGAETAASMQEMVKAASKSGTSVWATILGIGTLAFSATTVFISLQDSLNYIWGVKAKPQKGWIKYIVNRLLSFSIVASFGFLLLVSLSVDALIGALTHYLERYYSEGILWLSTIINVAISLGLLTLVFAMIYKILPDAKIKWRSVWTGAFVTTLLFVLGKTLIGWYIGFSKTESGYGAAGSVVLILVWVYYSAVILLLGAEFTKAYSKHTGHEIEPSAQAVKVEVKEIHRNDEGKVEEVKTSTGTNSMA